MAKILVTGGAGFIASHVADAYEAAGHSVVVLDNLVTGFLANVPPGRKFYNVDIRDREMVEEVFEIERPDIVNHHAAQMDVRKSTKYPAFDAACNVLGSVHLIDAAHRFGTAKFIYASTGGAVYGQTQYLPVREDHPINPISQYGISKHTVEHYLFLYRYNYKLDYTVLRYPNVFGPRQNPHGEAGVVAIFAELMLQDKQPRIFGDGSQTRDYTYIKDVVAANLAALDKGSGGIYNIGTGVGTDVNGVFRALAKEIGYSGEPLYVEPRVGEIQEISLDSSLAAAELGWTPQYDFDRGIQETVAWYRERR